MKLPVQFKGQNPMGQFIFANGTPLASDVFKSLPEAVARFGVRIDTQEKAMRQSTPWLVGRQAAEAGKPYAPENTGNQSRLEYGLGYLHGLLKK